ncbi:ribosome maturation factor RimM [Gloeobacter kilaueensis]|uniref:Ribosome maturation factor RimM n=1 Tax=Gloeobacter kilaueensis (strain ATCC BAA-2537 / CCAP 1431/1 / ULC 316 / JS1) TaxID=1183438 RepID=U5QBV2_GLOK1|nr:ribosome maturation factor RimM [Gloeobacter kilaueensis]AGY56362.1 16S rRNA-processing protein RimM [Gloeobacter kilaueensis JS1]
MSPDPPPVQNWLPIGRIVAAQGLRGEVRVQPLTDFGERLTRSGPRQLQPPGAPARTLELLSGRPLAGKGLFVCRFAGVADRSAAEALVGATLAVAEAERPTLAAGEFWLPDLMNAVVYRKDDPQPIGKVEDILRAGNDLLALRLVDGRRVLVPFVEALVPEVDLEAGRIVVVPIAGLLDPENAERDRPDLEGEQPEG